MTDNGPQFSGEPFQKFTTEWKIKHVTSSPHYPQSNGFIERHVKNIKALIRKAKKSGDDIQMVMMNVRTTPVDTKLSSPSPMMFGRLMTTILPNHSDPGPEHERTQHQQRQTTAERYYLICHDYHHCILDKNTCSEYKHT